MLSLPILSFDIVSFDMESFVIGSFAIPFFDMLSFDMLSFDMVSVLVWAKAGVPNASAPVTAAADKAGRTCFANMFRILSCCVRPGDELCPAAHALTVEPGRRLRPPGCPAPRSPKRDCRHRRADRGDQRPPSRFRVVNHLPL